MRLRQTNSMLEVMAICLFAAAAWALTVSAHAAGPAESASKDRSPPSETVGYEVKDGDSLGAIAAAHGIPIRDLMSANGLENPDRINAGSRLVIPTPAAGGKISGRGVRITVPKGVTLSRIAEVYGVSLSKIIRANAISNPDRLRSGRKILIPGATEVLELVPPPPCFKPSVEIFRLHNQERRSVSLCFCDGKPNPEAVEELSRLSAPLRKEVPFPLHPRLALLLQRIADEFPGKRIEIISGQRLRKSHGHESYHNKGQALDFRVQGVPNRQLAEFVRSFPNVGVGYYPNSVFIHMDTREKDAYWIDYSRPGERAIYGRAGMTDDEIAQIRAKRLGKTSAVQEPSAAEESQAEVESETDAEIDTAGIVEAVIAAAFPADQDPAQP